MDQTCRIALLLDRGLSFVRGGDLECNLSQPGLSSLAVPSQRVGYEAAARPAASGAAIPFYLGSVGAGGDLQGASPTSEGTAERHAFAHHGGGRTVGFCECPPVGRGVRQTHGPLPHGIPP